jgi:hypothetical protein
MLENYQMQRVRTHIIFRIVLDTALVPDPSVNRYLHITYEEFDLFHHPEQGYGLYHSIL